MADTTETSRAELSAVLSRVNPTLGSDFVQAFACFSFDGKHVTTYNDKVALSIACRWPRAEALRGDVLLGWLNASRAGEVKFLECNQTERILKMGRSVLTIPIIKEFKESEIFAWPEPGEGETFQFPAALLSALQKTAVSLASGTADEWRRGAYLEFDGKYARVYTSNNQAASCYKFKMKAPASKKCQQMLIPSDFVETLLPIAGRDAPQEITLTTKHIMVTMGSGLRLFSKVDLRVTEAPERYQSVFTEKVYAGAGKVLQAQPKGFRDAVARCIIVLGDSKDKQLSIRVKDGALSLSSQNLAKITERALKFEGHPDVEVVVRAPILQKASEMEEAHMGVLGNMVVFQEKNPEHDGTFFHMIAVSKDPSETTDKPKEEKE